MLIMTKIYGNRMKKILFLALVAFILTSCDSPNGTRSYSNSGVFLIELANSSRLVIDECDIEMYEITQTYEGIPYIFTHWIHLNDAGSERLDLINPINIWNEEFSIIFRGKELYRGIFVAAPSMLYNGYTIDIVFAPHLLVLMTEPNNTNLVDRKDEDELFAYFDSIGKLKRRIN